MKGNIIYLLSYIYPIPTKKQTIKENYNFYKNKIIIETSQILLFYRSINMSKHDLPPALRPDPLSDEWDNLAIPDGRLAQYERIEDEAQMHEIVSLYEQTKSATMVATEMGMTVARVYRVLKTMGVPMYSRGARGFLDRWTDEEVEEFLNDYYTLELPVNDIVDKYKLGDISRIYAMLAKLGKPARSRSAQGAQKRSDASVQLNHAIDLYQKRPDMTLREIYEETGINEVVLTRTVRARGIPGRRGRKLRLVCPDCMGDIKPIPGQVGFWKCLCDGM